jgi:hypothetical protein
MVPEFGDDGPVIGGSGNELRGADTSGHRRELRRWRVRHQPHRNRMLGAICEPAQTETEIPSLGPAYCHVDECSVESMERGTVKGSDRIVCRGNSVSEIREPFRQRMVGVSLHEQNRGNGQL